MTTNSPWSGVDPKAVLRALEYAEPADIEPFLGGWDTAIWRFSTEDGSEHALRLYRTPDRMDGAVRERVAMEAAASAGLPVPAVEAFGEWQGRPALVISWCPGEPLVRSIERRPWTMRRLARELGRLQARIHAVPPPDALREGGPNYWFGRLGMDDEAGILASALGSAELSSDTFLHGDIHPLNVLSDGRTITGIVDWTNAAAGDARADLAWTTFLLRVAPPPPGPFRPLYRFVRWIFYLRWRQGYESVAGPIPDLAPFLAWAGSVFLREAQPRIGEPQVWATEKDMEAVRRWIAHWKKQAGIQ